VALLTTTFVKGTPFHFAVLPLVNPLPVIQICVVPAPVPTLVGFIWVTRGPFVEKSSNGESTPELVPAVVVTMTGPKAGSARGELGIVAVMVEGPLTITPVKGTPFQVTPVVPEKFDPFMVTVTGGEPTGAIFGETETTDGVTRAEIAKRSPGELASLVPDGVVTVMSLTDGVSINP
jgi:hypothetical protein